jgi:hypothetical protein
MKAESEHLNVHPENLAYFGTDLRYTAGSYEGVGFNGVLAYIRPGMKTVLILLTLAVLAIGCATNRQPPPAPLTQSDIISMVKAGMGDEDIMRRIDDTHTVFRLSSEDVMRLRQEGVSDRIVNYMLETYTRAAVSEQRKRDFYEYDFYNRSDPYLSPWHRWAW